MRMCKYSTNKASLHAVTPELKKGFLMWLSIEDHLVHTQAIPWILAEERTLEGSTHNWTQQVFLVFHALS